jgi:hypothetical protein
MLVGGFVTAASTLPLWRDGLGAWSGFLLICFIPGFVIALPLSVTGLVGNAHDPNVIVIALVDAVVYGWLIYWLMTRRERHER